MNEQLRLDNVRNVLVRLEETILFAFIERAQFHANPVIYRPDALGEGTGGESLIGFLLRETERAHARVRRYTSPDEHAFFSSLPEPILPSLDFSENPLRSNSININSRLRSRYEEEIVPHICPPGDDGQYGSSAVADVCCLQVLSKRIHYGKFVAESKLRIDPAKFRAIISDGDAEKIREAITDRSVEQEVLDRVRKKSEAFARDVSGDPKDAVVGADRLVDTYREWVIPLTKDVQVMYLLEYR